MQKQNPVIKNYILSSEVKVLETKQQPQKHYTCEIIMKKQNINNLDSHISNICISG